MNIKKSNLFASYNNWIYGEYPKDVCSFFWGSLFAIGLFFFIVPGRLVSSDKNAGKHLGYGILLWIAYLFLVLIGNGVIMKFGYEFVGFWGIFGLGLLLGAGVVAVGFGGLFLVVGVPMYIQQQVSESNSYNSITTKTKDWVGAIRGKYCVKISWK